jgi:hypothetical protein
MLKHVKMFFFVVNVGVVAFTSSYNLFSLLVGRMMTNGSDDDEEEEKELEEDLDGKKRKSAVVCPYCVASVR